MTTAVDHTYRIGPMCLPSHVFCGDCNWSHALTASHTCEIPTYTCEIYTHVRNT